MTFVIPFGFDILRTLRAEKWAFVAMAHRVASVFHRDDSVFIALVPSTRGRPGMNGFTIVYLAKEDARLMLVDTEAHFTVAHLQFLYENGKLAESSRAEFADALYAWLSSSIKIVDVPVYVAALQTTGYESVPALPPIVEPTEVQPPVAEVVQPVEQLPIAPRLPPIALKSRKRSAAEALSEISNAAEYVFTPTSVEKVSENENPTKL